MKFFIFSKNALILLFTLSIADFILSKNLFILSTACETAFFIFSHSPIQKFLNHSHLFHKTANIATNATIATITKLIGFANITAFSAAIAVFTALNALTIFGANFIIVPTELIKFPMNIIRGPIAAAIARTTNTTFCAIGFNPVSQFAKLDKLLQTF